MKAHVCPKCNGERYFKIRIYQPNSTIPYRDETKICPTCQGQGVVWEQNSPKVGDTFQKVG